MKTERINIDNIPTILWGEKSDKVLEGGEHYFHTDEQLEFYKKWLEEIV